MYFNTLVVIILTFAYFAVVVGFLVTRVARDALRNAIDENGGDDESLITAADSVGATDNHLSDNLRQPLIIKVDSLSNGNGHLDSNGQLPNSVHKTRDSVL